MKGADRSPPRRVGCEAKGLGSVVTTPSRAATVLDPGTTLSRISGIMAARYRPGRSRIQRKQNIRTKVVTIRPIRSPTA